jgi:hypothetical protein
MIPANKSWGHSGVISSSLIIPKPNVSFFYFYLLPRHERTGMDKRLVGLT